MHAVLLQALALKSELLRGIVALCLAVNCSFVEF